MIPYVLQTYGITHHDFLSIENQPYGIARGLSVINNDHFEAMTFYEPQFSIASTDGQLRIDDLPKMYMSNCYWRK